MYPACQCSSTIEEREKPKERSLRPFHRSCGFHGTGYASDRSFPIDPHPDSCLSPHLLRQILETLFILFSAYRVPPSNSASRCFCRSKRICFFLAQVRESRAIFSVVIVTAHSWISVANPSGCFACHNDNHGFRQFQNQRPPKQSIQEQHDWRTDGDTTWEKGQGENERESHEGD